MALANSGGRITTGSHWPSGWRKRGGCTSRLPSGFIEDTDALHRHRNTGEQDFHTGKAEKSAAVTGALKAQQGEADRRGFAVHGRCFVGGVG